LQVMKPAMERRYTAPPPGFMRDKLQYMERIEINAILHPSIRWKVAMPRTLFERFTDAVCCATTLDTVALRALCQNFFCSHRFRRACHNQALPTGQHGAGKSAGCALWSRGPAAAVTVLRQRERAKTPIMFPPSVCGYALPRSLLWCSFALHAPFAVRIHGSPLLIPIRADTSSVPVGRHAARFVPNA
jgi:hypothetical protein